MLGESCPSMMGGVTLSGVRCRCPLLTPSADILCHLSHQVALIPPPAKVQPWLIQSQPQSHSSSSVGLSFICRNIRRGLHLSPHPLFFSASSYMPCSGAGRGLLGYLSSGKLSRSPRPSSVSHQVTDTAGPSQWGRVLLFVWGVRDQGLSALKSLHLRGNSIAFCPELAARGPGLGGRGRCDCLQLPASPPATSPPPPTPRCPRGRGPAQTYVLPSSKLQGFTPKPKFPNIRKVRVSWVSRISSKTHKGSEGRNLFLPGGRGRGKAYKSR